MLVTVCENKDVLTKESGESFVSFRDKVRRYQESTDCSVDSFCAQVGVRGISISDTVELSSYLRKNGGYLKKNTPGKTEGRKHVLP